MATTSVQIYKVGETVVPPKPNELLSGARRRLTSPSGSGRPMSRQELADLVNQFLHGVESSYPRLGGIDSKYIGKLERGTYRWPNELYRRAFRQVLNVGTDAELGFYVVRQSKQALFIHASAHNALPSRPEGVQERPIISGESISGVTSFPDGTDWPVWFGMRLARAVSLVHNWTGGRAEALQTLLHQEILMFDASTPHDQVDAFDTSRRQVLITLATLPLALGTLGSSSKSNAAAEYFLSHCSASLTACWHLLRGSDLETVDRLLSGYLMQLDMVARQPSRHQKTAARLASQAHRISGIIALHRNHIRAREHHCKQAVTYAILADDLPSHASALISLASTYFYEANPGRAATTYESALAYETSMSPLQRSRATAELAVVYGQLGQERRALESVEMAESLYPEMPEQDPSYLYAEFTRASLTLEQGLAYAALARRAPKHGYQHTAAEVFGRIEDASSNAVPERIRYEIINHQASTAILRQDLDAFESYVVRGIDGAVILNSKQRKKEVRTAWRLANTVWPNESRLLAIGRHLTPALTQ
jgi:tetratricopeptide (TPR) repeat protein